MTRHTLDQDIAAAEKDITVFARAIALKRATITAIGGAALSGLAAYGVITPNLSGNLQKDIATGLAFLTTVGAGAWIHKDATPADPALIPKDNTGTPLVPAAVAAQLVKQANDAQLITTDTAAGTIAEDGASVIDVPEAPAPTPIPLPAAPPVTAPPVAPVAPTVA